MIRCEAPHAGFHLHNADMQATRAVHMLLQAMH
jgi:hypothetical protein